MELHRLRCVIEAAESALDAAYRRDLSLALGCMATAIDDVAVVEPSAVLALIGMDGGRNEHKVVVDPSGLPSIRREDQIT